MTQEFSGDISMKKSANNLNLKTILTEKTLIKTFGQINDFKMQVLDAVQLKTKSQFEEKYNFVEALVVPVICSPLKNRKTKYGICF